MNHGLSHAVLSILHKVLSKFVNQSDFDSESSITKSEQNWSVDCLCGYMSVNGHDEIEPYNKESEWLHLPR
jgi:hypothetical protein